MMEEVLHHLATDVAVIPNGHPGSVARSQPMPEVPAQDADAWALRINSRWRQSIENFFETGQLLVDAKAALPYGQFESMVKTKLLFDPSTARRLMIISQDQRLRAHVHALPPSWGTLYDLTKLSNDEFDRGVAEKIIRADMERADVELLRPARIARPMTDQEILGSDGGVESRHANSPMARARAPSTDGHENGDCGLGRTLWIENGLSDDPAVVPEAGLASGPSETQMPSGGLAIAHRRDPNDKDPREFFPTPPWATRALIEHVFPHMGRPNAAKYATAWEPACGEGHMAETLKEYFKTVIASDKFEYPAYPVRLCDFLEEGHDIGADWIITNPPFRPSTDFVLKALDLAHHGVAMFVRLTWLESAGRYEEIFKPHPPTLLAIFSERVPLHKGRWETDGVTMTAYLWVVWIKGTDPRPPFWIPPICRKTLTRADDAKRFGVIEEEEAA